MDTEGGIGAGSSWDTPIWAVRIRRGDGTVAGAGVLVGPEWVLTCSFVVTGSEGVTAEFVGVPGAPRARLADDTRGPARTGGIALLRLAGPGPAGAASPLHRRSVPRRAVRIYGFPAADGAGAWLRATTASGGGRPDGRVRLSAGDPVPRGYGGAGVADADTGELLGMAHAAPDPDHDPHADPRAYMTPAESIVRQLPQATAWIAGRTAVDERIGARGAGAIAPELLDPDFATRLAAWFHGGTGSRGGDGRQVKISLVRSGDPVRGATLRRAVVLADRELRPEAAAPHVAHPRGTYAAYAADAPETVPPPGSLDLALDATGRSARWVAERVADRMGLGPSRGVPAAERVRTARLTLTLVVVGVDEATDPDELLALLALFRTHGDRMLLVFRIPGDHFARAQSQLVIEPGQQRQARLAEQLAEITGTLARSLHQKMVLVLADTSRSMDALTRAYAVQEELAGAGGIVPGLGQDPDLVRYERVAGWAAARLRSDLARLDELLSRRAELFGLLSGYHALDHGGTDSEQVASSDLYLTAYEALRAKPCDLDAAEAAVRRYVEIVERRGRGEPREGGDPR